jgi:hypothetical protein
MQQSQQRVSTAFVNQYGGAGNNSVITNENLFGACITTVVLLGLMHSSLLDFALPMVSAEGTSPVLRPKLGARQRKRQRRPRRRRSVAMIVSAAIFLLH